MLRRIRDEYALSLGTERERKETNGNQMQRKRIKCMSVSYTNLSVFIKSFPCHFGVKRMGRKGIFHLWVARKTTYGYEVKRKRDGKETKWYLFVSSECHHETQMDSIVPSYVSPVTRKCYTLTRKRNGKETEHNRPNRATEKERFILRHGNVTWRKYAVE